MKAIICRQKGSLRNALSDDDGCKEYAEFRYTWPGQDESYICATHAAGLRAIAGAMGVHIQLIPLTEEDHAGPPQASEPL